MFLSGSRVCCRKGKSFCAKTLSDKCVHVRAFKCSTCTWLFMVTDIYNLNFSLISCHVFWFSEMLHYLMSRSYCMLMSLIKRSNQAFDQRQWSAFASRVRSRKVIRNLPDIGSLKQLCQQRSARRKLKFASFKSRCRECAHQCKSSVSRCQAKWNALQQDPKFAKIKTKSRDAWLWMNKDRSIAAHALALLRNQKESLRFIGVPCSLICSENYDTHMAHYQIAIVAIHLMARSVTRHFTLGISCRGLAESLLIAVLAVVSLVLPDPWCFFSILLATIMASIDQAFVKSSRFIMNAILTTWLCRYAYSAHNTNENESNRTPIDVMQQGDDVVMPVSDPYEWFDTYKNIIEERLIIYAAHYAKRLYHKLKCCFVASEDEFEEELFLPKKRIRLAFDIEKDGYWAIARKAMESSLELSNLYDALPVVKDFVFMVGQMIIANLVNYVMSYFEERNIEVRIGSSWTVFQHPPCTSSLELLHLAVAV